MKIKNRTKKWISALLILVLFLAYPIYFCVVQNVTKSDSLMLFPSSGVWVAEAQGYSIKIDLDNATPTTTLTSTINNETIEIDLDISESGGHGTIIWPTSAVSILHFTSESLELGHENYVSFSCSKFKFNEEDFYLYKIYTYESNNLSIIKDKTTLHFFKES